MELSLHDELRLRQVALEASELNEEQARTVLLKTWERWLQERKMLLELVEAETGIRLEVEANHCTPRSLLVSRV